MGASISSSGTSRNTTRLAQCSHGEQPTDSHAHVTSASSCARTRGNSTSRPTHRGTMAARQQAQWREELRAARWR
jgi:hypothetical protein